MSTITAPELRLGTDMPAAAYDAVVEVMGRTDEHVEAAVLALQGLRDYYLQMEERPAFDVFAVATAKHLLDWTADAYVHEDDLLSPR